MEVTIPDFISKEITKIRRAEAILLTGSRVLGKAGENADWDFFIILKNGTPRWRKTWKVKNTWIEIFCNDKKQILKEFREDLEEGKGVTTYMFATGIVISDHKNVLHNLVRIAKKNWERGPNKLKLIKKTWIDLDISTYLQDIEDCIYDDNPAHLIFNHAANEFVNYDYRLRNIWMPRPKDRLEDMKKRSPAIYKLIQEINSTQNWKLKARKVIELGELIGSRNNLKLTGEAYIPAKKLAIRRK